MGRIEKTIFISYRRTNLPWALCIYQDLTMHGYDVFFDYQSIDSGNFEKVILENIKSRAHFLVILTPSALERCKEPNDWLRREIETAIDEKRNIIPLMLDSFDFGSPLVTEALTGKLISLKAFNGLRVYSEYFFEAMNKLRDRYLNKALDDIHLPLLNNEAKKITDAQRSTVSEARKVEQQELSAQEWFERGYVFQQDKNFEEAIRCYDEAIKLQPALFEPYNNLGILLNELKHYDKAEATFRKAIELNPLHATAYSNFGSLLYSLKRYDEAEATLRKAIKLNPLYTKAYNNLGVLLIDLLRFEEAEATFRKAIEINPLYAKAYNNLGKLLRDQQRYKEAESIYQKAIELDPSDFDFYNSLVKLYRFDLGANLEDTIPLLEKMIEIKDADYSSYLAIASINKILDKNNNIEHIEKARQFIPKDNWYNYACLESVCDNFDLAFEYLQKASKEESFNSVWAWKDPDLQWIRDDPRFVQIVGLKPE